MSPQPGVAGADCTEPKRDEASSSSSTAMMADNRRTIMEGFRSLGVLATFFAGLQAQMLAGSFLENSTTAAKLVNAFWFAGIFLDIFGAVLATMTARWFELLDDKEVETLKQGWSGNWAALPSPRQSLFLSLIDSIIAFALFSAFPIVAGGVILFLIGLVINVWRRQPLLVSIVSTIPVVILSPLIFVCFYPHSDRKTGIIALLARKRGAW